MRIPEELLERIERGDVLLLLGHGVNQGTQSSPSRLVNALAERASYPEEEEHTLAHVAEYYRLKRSRQDLIALLKKHLEASQKTQIHHYIVDLIGVATEHPLKTVITLCYDDLVEQVLRERGIPYTSVTRAEDISFTGGYRLLVVHLWGRQDQHDSLIITREDTRSFPTQAGSLYSWICGDLAQRTWLCLGVDLDDDWFQELYRRVFALQGEYGRRVYACGTVAGELSQLLWLDRNVQVIPLDVSCFLSELVGQLHARAKQRDAGPSAAAPSMVLEVPQDQPLERLPFKELRTFDREDEYLFFGREAEKHYLLQQILANRLTILTGSSGSGKSSLLNAGIVPRLVREGFAVGTARLFRDPLARLAEGIQTLHRKKLPAPPDVKLSDYLRSVCELLGQEVILIIDQFEELFARPLARQTQSEFLSELMFVVTERSIPVKVVLSLRSDWVHALRILDDWFPNALNYEVRIKRLTVEQARQAIVGPLQLLEISYEEQLVEKVVADLLQEVRDGAISRNDTFTQLLVDPPQLQLVCHALYSARASNNLDLHIYKEIGESRGVLRDFLRRKLQALGTEESLARRILESLVSAWDTKAARTLEEIQLEVSEEATVVKQTLGRMINDRLIRRDIREGDEYYELAHEYLVDEINLTEEMRSLKRAEHWLIQGIEEWRVGHTLLGRDQFKAINQERERIRSHLIEGSESEETRSLLLRCALRYDLDIAYWLDQVDASDLKRAVLLETTCDSEDPRSRAKSASMLGALLNESVEGVLYEVALSDDSPLVRQAAARSLGGCSAKTRGNLLTAAAGESRIEAIRAIEALGYAGMSDAVPALMSIASGNDVEMRSAAIRALDTVHTGFSFRWFFVRNRDMLLSDTAVFLTVVLALTVALHFFVIAGLGTGTAWLTSPFRQAVLRNSLILSYKLQWTFVLPLTLLAGAVALVGYLRFHAIRFRFASLLFIIICTAGVANAFYRPYELHVTKTKPAQVYNRAEYELVNAENLRLARRLFTEIRPYSKEGDLINAWLAGIDYLEGNYAQSIWSSCNWLAVAPPTTPNYEAISGSLVTTVHWSLYGFAQTMPFDEALILRDQMLQELTESYPGSPCIWDEELSPFFFGISPANRAFLIELPEKYAPPPLYAYLGILSGHPERYPLPEGASVSSADRDILARLLTLPEYGTVSWDSQVGWIGPARYANWAAFLIGDYDHPAIYDISYWEAPERAKEKKELAAAAVFAQAVSNVSADPAMGIARMSVYMDPSNLLSGRYDSYAKYLLYEDSPWLDDLYAILMFLWNEQGDVDRALDYYKKLSELDDYSVLCRFCNPWSVLGFSMSTRRLEALVASQDARIDLALCNPPYLLDLLGLRQLADGRYDDAQATFVQLKEQCGARYPGMDSSDYIRVVSLLETIDQFPTEEHYRKYFETMDQSWTWDYQGRIPFPETWFLQAAFYRTNNWPIAVFLEINPWVTYARMLEEYADRFAEQAEYDIRIPASLLQAASIYDVLSAYPGEMLTEDEQEEYTRQLRSLAVRDLQRYLTLYHERADVPPEFCRAYSSHYFSPVYNVVQDCTMEWMVLLHLAAPDGESTFGSYAEDEIVAMQEQARKLVTQYPDHHLANNLLSWIGWGFSYRANLYSVYSADYIMNYRNALLTYQELLSSYPHGDQAANARENIVTIEEKLRNPEARRPVPEGRWTWDVGEKPVPEFDDILQLLEPTE